jgi:hypothetical protein
MLKDVTAVESLDGYRLHIRFEDGVEGIVDLAEIVSFTGVFAPLKDRAYFVQVYANPDLGTICWPNGADVDPDVLYALVTGGPIPAPTHARHNTPSRQGPERKGARAQRV